MREAAHSHHAVQDAAAFVAVDGAELGPTQRQLAVRPAAVLIDEDVAGAVHRLDPERLLLDLHRAVHHVAVVLEVPRDGEQRFARDVRRVHGLVAGARVELPPEALDLAPHDAEVRVPEHEAAAGFCVRAEEVELRPEPSVVALFDLFEPREVLVERLLRPERGAVDALEHRPRFVAAPIRTRDRQQLERERMIEPIDVRALAEVGPIAVAVERDGLVRRNEVERFDLVRLTLRSEPLTRDFARHRLARDDGLFLGDAPHLLLDASEVLLRQRLRQVEVVVEAVLDRRPETEPHTGKEARDGGGHQVRRRVAQGREGKGAVGPTSVFRLLHQRSVLGLGHGNDPRDSAGVGWTRRPDLDRAPRAPPGRGATRQGYSDRGAPSKGAGAKAARAQLLRPSTAEPPARARSRSSPRRTRGHARSARTPASRSPHRG